MGTGAGFSLPEGRYRTFISSGTSFGIAFEAVWSSMREEVGADPAGVFSRTAADAPGRPESEDEQENEGGGAPHLQRHCTRARQGARARALNASMQALPVNAPVRMAWDNRCSGEVWTTLPRATTVFSAAELRMAF